ncbi:MAG: hypothetical protein ACOYVD_09560 [Bacillota bacterium]
MYHVNKNFVNLALLFVPLGITLLSGFFIESLASVKQLSFVFLTVGLVSNFYYPQIININEDKIMLKLTLAKKYKEFPLNKLEVSVDSRARYLILHLDRKYRLDVKTLPTQLYYQLKPFIKIISQK